MKSPKRSSISLQRSRLTENFCHMQSISEKRTTMFQSKTLLWNVHLRKMQLELWKERYFEYNWGFGFHLWSLFFSCIYYFVQKEQGTGQGFCPSSANWSISQNTVELVISSKLILEPFCFFHPIFGPSRPISSHLGPS